MAKSELELSYPGFFNAEKMGNVVVMRFSGNFFHNCIDFDKKDFFTDYLKKVGSAEDIHAVILHSAYSETGENEYLKFFLREQEKRPLAHFGFSSYMGTNEINRYCNFLDQFILELIQINKFIIHVCSGDVLTQSMNIALACDHRIIGDDTVFHNIFQKVGTVPKGGSIFFMERLLGRSKTLQLLLLQPGIDAAEVFENGLVDRMVAAADIEKEALKVAETVQEMAGRTVAGIKRLTRVPLKELESYLDRETAEITRVGNK